MNLRRSILLASLVSLLAAGCGGGDGGGPTGLPPNDENEPNDFTAQSVGTLTATDMVLDGTTSNASDVDLFRVTTTSTAALLVELDWSGSPDLELAISNANGVFIRHVDTASHPETCTLANLAPGDYTVRVGSFTNSATNYTLKLGQR